MDQYAVTYLPYLNMGETAEIGFGSVKIWNFDKKKDEYITDPALKAKLEKIFYTHVADGKPIAGIGIFSIGANDFREFDDAEKAQLRIARILLFICFVARCNLEKRGGNAGHSMATTENFDVIVQRFLMGDDHISESSGEIVHFNRFNFDISQVTFQRPGFVPTPWRIDLDMDLAKMLLELQASNPTEFEKIINAGEIFMQGYYNSHYISQNARVLLQMSAFEILLDLPEQGQRKAFKEVIKQRTVVAGEPTFSHQSERSGGRFETEMLTKKEIWADLFYTLRNHIIHGNTPPAADFAFENTQSHTDIAILFFILMLRKKMEDALPKYPCYDEIKWESWNDPLGHNLEGFVYHRSLRQLWETLANQASGK
jgi:hypothetical protein